MKLTFGCDPEFFLKDKETGLIVSAHDKVPGDKENPFQMCERTTIQADGMAVEVGITPTDSPEEFVRRVKLAMSNARDMIDSRYEFYIEPTARFRKAEVEKVPAHAKELGCSPDYEFTHGSASLTTNPTPKMPDTYRVAGGHIHVGWDVSKNKEAHIGDCSVVISAVEGFLIQEYLRNAPKKVSDKEIRRKKYYGKDGSGRVKSYGVEVRSPSNVWLKDVDKMEKVLWRVRRAFS